MVVRIHGARVVVRGTRTGTRKRVDLGTTSGRRRALVSLQNLDFPTAKFVRRYRTQWGRPPSLCDTFPVAHRRFGEDALVFLPVVPVKNASKIITTATGIARLITADGRRRVPPDGSGRRGGGDVCAPA